MKRSNDRIITTTTGSLPRPDDLVALLAKKDESPAAHAAFRERVKSAIVETVRSQVDAGIDVVSDGEMGKPSFVHYVRDRLTGFEGITMQPAQSFVDGDYPGYSAWRAGNRAGSPNPFDGRPECIGPLKWRGSAILEEELAAFKAAIAETSAVEGFIPCASVGIVAQRLANAYYPTYEDFVQAIAEAMREEYEAIARAGLIVQIDAPEMCIDRNLEFREAPIQEFLKRQELWVEALNHALEKVPEEQVRFHICWGNHGGPHNRDIELKEIVHNVLKVKAAGFSIEAANPRHAHEWKVWQDVKLPDGKVLIPGVIDSTTNFVEHPELVEDRIVTFANLVGRENVIAGTDCGFATSATSQNIYPPITWGKLRTLAEGAARASKRLWS